jgi:hypothetical protein
MLKKRRKYRELKKILDRNGTLTTVKNSFLAAYRAYQRAGGG